MCSSDLKVGTNRSSHSHTLPRYYVILHKTSGLICHRQLFIHQCIAVAVHYSKLVYTRICCVSVYLNVLFPNLLCPALSALFDSQSQASMDTYTRPSTETTVPCPPPKHCEYTFTIDTSISCTNPNLFTVHFWVLISDYLTMLIFILGGRYNWRRKCLLMIETSPLYRRLIPDGNTLNHTPPLFVKPWTYKPHIHAALDLSRELK